MEEKKKKQQKRQFKYPINPNNIGKFTNISLSQNIHRKRIMLPIRYGAHNSIRRH